MSAIMNKTDTKKTVRDASAEAPQQQPSAATARKVVDAANRDIARNNAEAAENNLRKAADDMRGTMERTAESAGEAAVTTRRMAEQVAEQVAAQAAEKADEMSAMQNRASKELASRTQQNLGVMMKTGVKLAEGYQSIMREWADYTRNAMQCNIDGMKSIMRARTPQDLKAAHSELLNAEVRVMLSSGVKISEATLRVAREAADSVNQHARQQGAKNS
jgi:hypothetical protein